MNGTVIISHGFESGPDAAKTVALAAVAERLGWQSLRPDYRAEDARGLPAAVLPRCERLRTLALQAAGPVVLAGSSLGAFVSGWVSREVACAGLFLLAVPAPEPGQEHPFDLGAGIPATLVHGHADELCPAEAAWRFAHARGLQFLAVPDGHRLERHVEWIAAQFELFLAGLADAA